MLVILGDMGEKKIGVAGRGLDFDMDE